MGNRRGRPRVKRGEGTTVIVKLTSDERGVRQAAIAAVESDASENTTVCLADLDRNALVAGYKLVAAA